MVKAVFAVEVLGGFHHVYIVINAMCTDLRLKPVLVSDHFSHSFPLKILFYKHIKQKRKSFFLNLLVFFKLYRKFRVSPQITEGALVFVCR